MYEFELQQQAEKTKKRVLLIVYVVALITAILVGIGIRMQEVKNIELGMSGEEKEEYCEYCIYEQINFNATPAPTVTAKPTASATTTPTPSPTSTSTPTFTPTKTEKQDIRPTSNTNNTLAPLSVNVSGPTCIEKGQTATFLIQITNSGTKTVNILEVQNSLPQGFSYVADSALINNSKLTSDYITIDTAGNAMLIKFKIPDAFNTIEPGKSLELEFKAIANDPNIGKNTDLTIVVPFEGQAIDNITYQFEVATSCATTTPNLPTGTARQGAPDTGIFDNAIILAIISILLISLGIYIKNLADFELFNFLGEFYHKVNKKALELWLRKDSKAYLEYKIFEKANKRIQSRGAKGKTQQSTNNTDSSP